MASPKASLPGLIRVVVLFLAMATHSTSLTAQQVSPLATLPITVSNVTALLQRVQAANPFDLETNSTGRILSVTLRQDLATDDTLTLITNLGSLRRLVIMPNRRGNLTTRGISALSSLTNLVSLHLSCSGNLPEGVFREICNLTQIRCLALYGARPPESEYSGITNLQNLVQLNVTYCTNFGDRQLSLITNLPNLRSIEVWADALSAHATNLLARMNTLTNIATKPNYR